jgi:hypothetical protein
MATTSALRKHDFSFINGATGVFDWTPITEYYNIAPTSQNADAHAISCIYHPSTHNIPGWDGADRRSARARPRPCAHLLPASVRFPPSTHRDSQH